MFEKRARLILKMTEECDKREVVALSHLSFIAISCDYRLPKVHERSIIVSNAVEGGWFV